MNDLVYWQILDFSPSRWWAVVPRKYRDRGPDSADPRDWDRDSKPRDSRDRDKNLRDNPGTKILRDNKARHFGTRFLVSPGTVPLSWNSMGRESRSDPLSLDLIWRIFLIKLEKSISFNIFNYNLLMNINYVSFCKGTRAWLTNFYSQIIIYLLSTEKNGCSRLFWHQYPSFLGKRS